MKLNKAKFLNYQRVFHNKVVNSPMTATIQILSVTAGDTIDAFVGAQSIAVVKEFSVQVLYEYSLDLFDRENIGLASTDNVTIYVSPLDLEKELGTHQLNANLTQVHFLNHDYIASKIEYKENLWDTCIAVELDLTLKTRQ